MSKTTWPTEAKEQIQVWVDALRSGEYKQGTQYLYCPSEEWDEDKHTFVESEHYCCLGVLARESGCRKATLDSIGLLHDEHWDKGLGEWTDTQDTARTRRLHPDVNNWLKSKKARVEGKTMTVEQAIALRNDHKDWSFKKQAAWIARAWKL